MLKYIPIINFILMNLTMRNLILLLFIFLNLILNASNDEISEDKAALELTKKMIKKIKSYNTFKYTLTKLERIEGKMVKEKLSAKIQARPLNVYFRQAIPVDGREVLYKTGQNNGKALINPAEFPWVNVNLNPQGGLMRKDQHHSLFAFDFNYLISFLEFLLNKYESKAHEMVEILEDVTWDGRTCYHIEMQNPNFNHITYTVKEGENLISIAKKLRINEYMILDLNNNIDSYTDISAGQIIKVPNDYAKKMSLYLDKEYLLPVLVKVYDNKGLYEHFEYVDLKVNPEIKAEEFTQDYKEYGF
jgi:hypothetical protein